MPKKNSSISKIISIALSVLVLMWGVLMYIQKLDQDRMSRIESDLKEITEIRKEIMAIAVATAESNVRAENMKKQLEKIEEKLDR